MGNKRILIADDAGDILEIAQLSLEMATDWEILTARSVHEALTVARSEQPDAILLDITMPEMDGIAVFQQLQANPFTADIPVILMTARSRLTDRQQFTQLGIAAAIAKPFDPVNLANQIAKASGWPLPNPHQ